MDRSGPWFSEFLRDVCVLHGVNVLM